MAVVMNTFNMLTYILLANHSLSTIVTLIVILKCATELYTGIVWDLYQNITWQLFNVLTYILLPNHSLSTIVTLIRIFKLTNELYTELVWDLKYWNFFLNHSSFNAQFNYKHVVWIFIPPHTYIFVSHIPTNNK